MLASALRFSSWSFLLRASACGRFQRHPVEFFWSLQWLVEWWSFCEGWHAPSKTSGVEAQQRAAAWRRRSSGQRRSRRQLPGAGAGAAGLAAAHNQTQVNRPAPRSHARSCFIVGWCRFARCNTGPLRLCAVQTAATALPAGEAGRHPAGTAATAGAWHVHARRELGRLGE